MRAPSLNFQRTHKTFGQSMQCPHRISVYVCVKDSSPCAAFILAFDLNYRIGLKMIHNEGNSSFEIPVCKCKNQEKIASTRSQKKQSSCQLSLLIT